MAFTVMVWNLHGGLSDGQRYKDISDEIWLRAPEVAVFPQAYREDRVQYLEEVGTDFAQARRGFEGREYRMASHEESSHDGHGLLAIVCRKVLRAYSGFRLVGRMGIQMEVADPGTGVVTQFAGVRFDNHREDVRLNQAEEVVNGLQRGRPSVVAGTMNSLHRQDGRTRMLRMMRPILPGLASMAKGGSLIRLEDAGLRDADPRHRPTTPERFPVVQPDHIMVSPGVEVVDYNVLPQTKLSDHRAVMARIAIRNV